MLGEVELDSEPMEAELEWCLKCEPRRSLKERFRALSFRIAGIGGGNFTLACRVNPVPNLCGLVEFKGH